MIFSARANAQLRVIHCYIAREAGHDTADDYLLRIVERCRSIADVPRGGTPRESFGKGLRSVPLKGSATIFYRVRREEIVIAAVLRRGRDVERHFRPR